MDLSKITNSVSQKKFFFQLDSLKTNLYFTFSLIENIAMFKTWSYI